MLKLALAATAITATGTTVYLVHTPSAAPAQAAATSQNAPSSVARAIAAPAAPKLAPTSPRSAALPPGLAISRDAMPILDDAAIAHAHLTQGPSRGPANAPVTITLFTDLTCTHCGNALGTIDQLFDDYPNKLRLVVKQLPVHAIADELPAEAAFAADAQGKFWPMFDQMFAHQDELSHDSLLELAQQAGLDVAAVRTALDSHTYAPAVAADAAEAKDIELNATPSFVINGRRVIGNWPIAELKTVIDDALAHPNG